jgi:chromate transporter
MLAACLGVITPSILIILCVAYFIKDFLHIEAVAHAFNGIRVAVAALIAKTVYDMGRKCLKDVFRVALFIAALAAFTLTRVSPVIPVLAGAAAGVVWLSRRRES